MYEMSREPHQEGGVYLLAHTPVEMQLAEFIEEQGESRLLAEMRETERQIAAGQAQQLRRLAQFAAMRPAKDNRSFSEFAADEVAVALGWTRNQAAHRLHLAVAVTKRLPDTLDALEHGDLNLRQVEAIEDLTSPLPVETARQVEAAVLPKAARWNTSELRRAVRRVIARLDPEGVKDRAEVRKQDRRVEFIPMDDCMAALRAYLPAADATRIYQKLDTYAKAVAPGDDRTADQRRADVFVDLMLDAANGKNGGVLIQVTVPASTLMGLDEQSGELAGYGEITAEQVREIAARDAIWKRILTDPASGNVLDYGRKTYSPPAALADHVRARDRRCIFPGCMRAAKNCDIDHRIPYPEGPTSADNLACLCRHHHRLKHEGAWVLDKRGDQYVWTSPTGAEYLGSTGGVVGW
jgi:hypothetical protein